jgi:hypothetical protein
VLPLFGPGIACPSTPGRPQQPRTHKARDGGVDKEGSGLDSVVAPHEPPLVPGTREVDECWQPPSQDKQEVA